MIEFISREKIFAEGKERYKRKKISLFGVKCQIKPDGTNAILAIIVY